VHLRRLLPVEELLSQFPSTGGLAAKSSSGALSSMAKPAPAARALEASAQAISPKPAFSPFEQSRKRFDEPPAVTQRAAVPVASPAPVPVAPAVAEPVAPAVESASPVPEISSAEAPSAE